MKRFAFILAAVLCLATATMNAQTYVGDFVFQDKGVIPSSLTTNGQPYVFFMSWDGEISIYQSDFTTHVTDINDASQTYFYDFDNYCYPYDLTGTISQSLFNTDDDFEYLCNYGTTLYIKSTNGNTLWTFNAAEGCYISSSSIIKLDNKYYVMVCEYNNVGIYHLYLIDQTEGLTKVETELPISVFPSIANRNQQITVELGEGNNAKEVTVVNGLGQVIKRMSVEEGQRQITIPAQELNSGLNVVNSRTQQGQGSCKIIVH